MSRIPDHLQGLLAYIQNPSERADEDLAISFFRQAFPEFTRQSDASMADGYVPGVFVLELKARASDWFIGLLQALAYNRDLDFSQIVVCAKGFLAIWSVDRLPEDILDSARIAKGSASAVGKRLAKKYASRKQRILADNSWILSSELVSEGLFNDPKLIIPEIDQFLTVLRLGKKLRKKITTDNFTQILKQMTGYFPPEQPLMAVRAFYSMIFGWTDGAKVAISHKSPDQVTVSGETITSLIPSKRSKFADFVEQYYIFTRKGEHIDDFFAKYDKALDTVDRHFRKGNGIFFTDPDLSRFAIWTVKRAVGEIGRNYLVIDPACGSGNLVMTWRSPLDLRHKVVSEIEPELLFAVERRIKGDYWHQGRFTVVPFVSENRGLNFLDVSAETYLETLRRYLVEKGHNPDRPIAILCNPPYRNDDDQGAAPADYTVHSSILSTTGKDASAERYCCFLAQMRHICRVAKDTGLPGDSLLLIFTKSAWLTRRPIFSQIRSEVLSHFKDLGGFLITGREFFDLKGKFPVAFTIWRYVGEHQQVDPERSIPLIDLTWATRDTLSALPWDNHSELEKECKKILSDSRAITAQFGQDRIYLDSDWAGTKIKEFQRDRRKAEKGNFQAGGLPKTDERRNLKKTYGESDGMGIGFMDDLTPCRVKHYQTGKPWFRLNKPFMDARKTRCFSGPPDQKGYCAETEAIAERLFLWFAISRAFDTFRYPMWTDADKLWVPNIPPSLEDEVLRMAFSIGYAENECIEATFPANDPILGVPEIYLPNPMSPLDPDSFWSTSLQQYFRGQKASISGKLVSATDRLYELWDKQFVNTSELPVNYERSYFIGAGYLTKRAGIRQIIDFANENQIASLLEAARHVQGALKIVKSGLHELLLDESKIAYFSAPSPSTLAESNVARFPSEDVLHRRLALAGYIVSKLYKQPTFGRTKLAKLFYLADALTGENLEMKYYREAAGPLDPVALYHKRIGLEQMAARQDHFQSTRSVDKNSKKVRIRYTPGTQLESCIRKVKKEFADGLTQVDLVINSLRRLNTERCEIIATLFACWNDLLIAQGSVSDAEIVDEFVHQWHQSKKRFDRNRLFRALSWMRHVGIVPSGTGHSTINQEPPNQDDLFH